MNRASGLAASFSWFYKTVIGNNLRKEMAHISADLFRIE